MNLSELVIIGLATWRLSALLAYEEGPWDLLTKLRILTGVYWDRISEVRGDNVLAKGIICVWCNSVWIGALAAICHHFWPTPTLIGSVPLALSAVAILTERLAHGNVD